MSTSTRQMIDGLLEAAGKAASANRETQQEVLRHWARAWAPMVGAAGILRRCRRCRSSGPISW